MMKVNDELYSLELNYLLLFIVPLAREITLSLEFCILSLMNSLLRITSTLSPHILETSVLGNSSLKWESQNSNG